MYVKQLHHSDFKLLQFTSTSPPQKISIKHTIKGGFKHIVFPSLFGEDEPILTSIFFNWVVQPPTSYTFPGDLIIFRER